MIFVEKISAPITRDSIRMTKIGSKQRDNAIIIFSFYKDPDALK